MKFKILKWLFRSSKSRDNSSLQHETNPHHENVTLNTSVPHKILHRQKPSQDNRSIQCGITDKKIKSYPTSPRRASEEDRGYVSDYNGPSINIPSLTTSFKPENVENKNVLSENFPSTLVYTASEQRDSSPFRPRATLGSNEPFPFVVPTDPVPRKSLFYDLSYGVDAQTTYKDEEFESQKPVRNSRISQVNNPTQSSVSPRFSQFNNQTRRSVATRVSQANYPIRSSVSRRISQINSPMQSSFASRMSQVNSQNRNSVAPRISQVGRVSQMRRVSRIPPTYLTRSSMAKENKKKESVSPGDEEEPLRKSVVKVKPFMISNYNENANVRRLSLKPPKRSSVKISIDGKVLSPVNRDKLRTSLTQERDLPVMMTVMQNPNKDSQAQYFQEEIPTNDPGLSIEEPNFLSKYYEIDERPADPEEFNNESGNNENELEYQSFPFKQNENEPMVYAIPSVPKKNRKSILQTVFPSRGRTRSVLQDSVKSLTSKNEPEINRKNIRYSMDTDVFASESRRGNGNRQSPTYVNMERGGAPTVVSEVLNPITSLFISDLKDPIPKDPLNKPREGNVWVKPRNTQPPNKPTPQIQVYQEPRGVPKQNTKSQSHTPYDDETSSSEESIIVYRKKSKPTTYRKSFHRPAVYATHTIDTTLPQFTGEHRGLERISTASSSTDLCGLQSYQNVNKVEVKKIVPDNLTDFEDELDLICYPSNNMLKDSLSKTDSKSKLRWRIIIKRGEDN